MEPVFEVLAPGLLTTVQDDGRHGFGDLGVPISGACDPWSLAVANALAGNEPRAAALECTLLGPELRALRDVVVGIAGADFEAEVRPSRRGIAPGSTVGLATGEVLALKAAAAGGVRAYIAVAGGLDVPEVLGSRSTCLVAAFGGFDGRALRTGDLIAAGRMALRDSRPTAGVHWPGPATAARAAIRILPGPEATDDIVLGAANQVWSVSPSSDRRGVRLVGEPLSQPPGAGERLTSGVLPGTIQLPPDGQPIVLLADAQPTGGYPVIGVVIEADIGVVGQLGAATELRFVVVSFAEAHAANEAARAMFDRGRAGLDGRQSEGSTGGLSSAPQDQPI